MRAILLTLLLLIPSAAWAWEDWDTATKNSFARTTNWIILDWHSTDMAAADGWDGYREMNPILGSYPSREDIAVYMIARIGINYWMHEQGWADAANAFSIGHAFAAASNYNLRGDGDKIAHIALGAVVSETVYRYTGSRWKGCAAALGAGIVKETIDKRTHSFDPADAFATGLGCSIIRIEF